MKTLKEKCNKLEKRLKDIENLTKTRWSNIDKVINLFQIAILFLLGINISILVILYLNLHR